MRPYTVQAGDTPASIAIEFAGCPKCARDLIAANPHKRSIVFPNGYATFEKLRAGETLILPDKWFDGSLDDRPKTYFQALPYPDGVTPSTLGDAALGVLGDFSTLDQASAAVAALAQMSDRDFQNAIYSTAMLINKSVNDVIGGANPTASGYAQDAQAGAAWAISASAQTMDPQTRTQIQNVLSTALGSARLALNTFHAAPAGPSMPANVVAAAQAASAAIAADANYCSSVGQNGSAVNSAVHAFKTAWNVSQSPKVPVGTGNYEQATADALSHALGTVAPAACPPRAQQAGPSGTFLTPPAPSEEGMSLGTIVGAAVLVAGAAGGVVYLATQKREPKRRRPPVRRRQISPVPEPHPTFYYHPED